MSINDMEKLEELSKLHPEMFIESYPGKEIELSEKQKRLYHFTSFETFVKIWLTKKLRFSPPENVNDILETGETISVPTQDAICLITAYQNRKPLYKQISLTMDYTSYIQGCMSTFMWGHYGNKKRGVCIEFDASKLDLSNPDIFHGPVEYTHEIRKHKEYCLSADIKTIEEVDEWIAENRNAIFFTKHLDWKGENEYRIISKELEYLDISQAISNVYLTSHDSQECLLTEQLVQDAVPVKQVDFRNCIPYIAIAKNIRAEYDKARKKPLHIELKKQSEAKYARMLEAYGQKVSDK